MIMKMHTEISKNNNNNSDLGSRLASYCGESRQSAFLFQRISVAIQRLNSSLAPRHIYQR